MENAQGALVWRQAVINLEGIVVQKLKFVHELPKLCPLKYCPRGNVAIAQVQLECEVEAQADVFNAEVCYKRMETSAACEQSAVDYDTKGNLSIIQGQIQIFWKRERGRAKPVSLVRGGRRHKIICPKRH